MDIIMKYGCTIAKVGTYFAQCLSDSIWICMYKKAVHHILPPSPNSQFQIQIFSDYFDAKNNNKTTFESNRNTVFPNIVSALE